MIKAIFFKIFNGKWSAPFFISSVGIFCWIWMLILPVNKIIWNLCFITPIMVALGYIILGISKIFKKRFKEGLVQVVLSVVFMFITAIFFTVLLPKSPYKEYKGDIYNPNNVKVDMPLKLSFSDEKPLFKVDKPEVILYDYNQPGTYKYQVFLNKIEKGTVYLKMFDLTTNRILSEKEIAKDTKVKVENPSDELKEFPLSKQFNVQEGDWGDYYGSRVEVWFKPEDASQPERKLLVKNYVIQGW